MRHRVNGREIEDYQRFDVMDTGLAIPRAESLYVPAISNGIGPSDFIVDDDLVMYAPLYRLRASKFKTVDRYRATGTVTGALWRPNGRLSDSVDDRTLIADHAAIQNIFDGGGTLMSWINPASDGEDNFGQIMRRISGWLHFVTGEAGGAVKVRFSIVRATQNGQWITDDPDVPLNAWTMVTATYNSDHVDNNAIIYINKTARTVGSGLTEDSIPIGARVSDVGDDLSIGGSSDGSLTFDGLVGESWQYTRIFTLAEVTHNLNATKWRYQ
ncbi:hypothetical protein LCGC14_1281090 [marine sediment metagenome]|uniref:LamG-like jellyroll fold domain-containing protein n=1 Tax=marine sediment metagenome TaxID=412755 RepID=A0A0F9KWT9_9ZZZZ